MRRALLLAVVLACALPGQAAGADGGLASLLPAGAKVVKSVKIAGYKHAVAVAYTRGSAYIAAAITGTRHDHVIWTKAVPSRPAKILSPGPTGAFIIVSSSGSAETVSVYRLHGGSVAWALSGSKGQPLTVGQLIVRGKWLETNVPDAAHVGSVPYRYHSVFSWKSVAYEPVSTVREPGMAPKDYPKPNGVVHTKSGNVVLMKLETAWTVEQQSQGLMYRESLDPDSGMVFVWPQLTDATFYMANTLVPLTVAFLAPDGTVLDMQDMTPLDSTTYHSPDISRCATQTPGKCYQYAIEMNRGFFTANGIQLGDKVVLTLPCSTFKGFQSGYVKCYS